MSYIDVIIPGIFGLWLLFWPQSMFYGSHATPDETKILRLRGIGLLLLVMAWGFLVLMLAKP